MAGPTRLLYGGGLVAAGLLGSAFALGGAALLGGFDDGTTTVSVQTPPVAGPISLKQAGTALDRQPDLSARRAGSRAGDVDAKGHFAELDPFGHPFQASSSPRRSARAS